MARNPVLRPKDATKRGAAVLSICAVLVACSAVERRNVDEDRPTDTRVAIHLSASAQHEHRAVMLQHLETVQMIVHDGPGWLVGGCADASRRRTRTLDGQAPSREPFLDTHGRRIRACLKQPEFAPVSVPAQIAVLLALTARLFDQVPIDQMADAEHALYEAAENIPADVSTRFETAGSLSNEDRRTIIEIARHALARFQPKPESNPEHQVELDPEGGSKPNASTETKPRPEAEVKPKPTGEIKGKS